MKLYTQLIKSLNDRALIIKINIPSNENELLQRAQALAGLTLAEIATDAGVMVPKDLTREKGWIGLLLEQVLGASAGSKPEPDFPH